MKKYIKILLKKILYKFGLIFSYIPAEPSFVKRLSGLSSEEQAYELRKLSTLLKEINNQKAYERLLKTLVPRYQIPKIASFIGNGASKGSLKTFRKIEEAGNFYFEKVYFNSHVEYRRIKWFYKNIQPSLNDFNIPHLKTQYSGSFVTVLQFDYLNLPKIQEDKPEEFFISISKGLMQFTFLNNVFLESLRYPPHILDFKQHFVLRKNLTSAKHILEDKNIDFKTCLDKVKSTQKVITHGDIYIGNAYLPNILIDWDNFGFYPIGLDPAFIFQRLNLHQRYQDPLQWLARNFKEFEGNVNQEELEFNFLFFLFVMNQEKEKHKKKRAVFDNAMVDSISKRLIE